MAISFFSFKRGIKKRKPPWRQCERSEKSHVQATYFLLLRMCVRPTLTWLVKKKKKGSPLPLFSSWPPGNDISLARCKTITFFTDRRENVISFFSFFSITTWGQKCPKNTRRNTHAHTQQWTTDYNQPAFFFFFFFASIDEVRPNLVSWPPIHNWEERGPSRMTFVCVTSVILSRRRTTRRENEQNNHHDTNSEQGMTASTKHDEDEDQTGLSTWNAHNSARNTHTHTVLFTTPWERKNYGDFWQLQVKSSALPLCVWCQWRR